MENTTRRPSGMFGFTVVWLGQIVSVLASSMSQFALTIFMYEKTQSATAMGLMQVFYFVPFLLVSPIAGVMVDRYNRKVMMMVSDLGSGLATVCILILQALGILQFWHLYVTAIIYGLGTAYQWPAYSAAISTMVPKEQLGRARSEGRSDCNLRRHDLPAIAIKQLPPVGIPHRLLPALRRDLSLLARSRIRLHVNLPAS